MLYVLGTLLYKCMYYGHVCISIHEKRIYIDISSSTGLLELIILLVLLYQQMQWSIIPGVVLLILVIPINLFLQNIQKKLTV